MRIAFYDPSHLRYTALTPVTEPLGGSQSAVCYLAIELAKVGHDVSIVNNITFGEVCAGVTMIPHRNEWNVSAILNSFDVVVVLSLGRMRDSGVTVPLVLFTQLATDQIAVGDLHLEREIAVWRGFAFVSAWQLEQFVSLFDLPRQRCKVLRNAMAPPFASVDPIQNLAFGVSPVLAYTSTPFRGLDVLLASWPDVRKEFPGAVLRVFSGMSTYQVPDKYQHLYERMADIDGVCNIGPVGQQRLAHELSAVNMLVYPCTFAETSCIAVIEALAVGAEVVCTDLGALPETASGFAHLVELPRQSNNAAEINRVALRYEFSARVNEVLAMLSRSPGRAFHNRRRQVDFVRRCFAWPDQAKQWSTWLTELVNGPRSLFRP